MTENSAHTEYEIETGVFPSHLLVRDRWFVWALDQGRKIPRAPWENPNHIDKFASWKNKEIWTDFETASEWVEKVPRFGHASCIPTYEDNSKVRLIFFDFDDCRDPETEAIHLNAWRLIQKYDLAAFISTSGTGLHGFAYGQIPEGYKPSFDISLKSWPHGDDAELEVYASARFMALTGEHIVGTRQSPPRLDSLLNKMFDKKGTERTTGTKREPEVSRSEIVNVDSTTDIDDIYDAIRHVRPRDIRLRSPVTQEYNSGRDANCARDPSWANSKSGTRVAEFDDHWLYRKGNHNLDALQIVALEERIITEESQYPTGEDFVEAVDALRERGAHIPDLKGKSNPDPPDVDPPTTIDNTETTDDETSAPDEEDGDDSEDSETLDWETVRKGYQIADNADERLGYRYQAVQILDRDMHWRNIEETDALWCYDDSLGIFDPNGDLRCREVLVRKLRAQYRGHEKNEMIQQLKGRNTVPEERMGGPDGMIACANGVLNIGRSGEITIEEHDPDHEFISALGTEYDPDADCPRFKQFLNETVSDPNDRLKLQEYAGYCLMHWKLPHHKALFIVGPTASGKSTFLDAIRAMLGNDSTVNLTPQEMTSERFGGAELYGSWANIRNDIPAQMIENTGSFKELVAGDPVKAERKYEDPFMFEPDTKHLFSANQLPEASTDDEAFYRRILLAAFPETIPRPDRDARLDSKLEDELSGILNWALDGLQRLQEQAGFTGDRSPGMTQNTWEKWCNSVKRFVQVCVEDNEDEVLPKAKAYDAYLAFCNDEGIPHETRHKFTRDFKNYSGYEDGRSYINAGGGKSQKRVFFGCQLTGRGDQYETAYDSDTDTDNDPDTATGDEGTGIDDY